MSVAAQRSATGVVIRTLAVLGSLAALGTAGPDRVTRVWAQDLGGQGPASQAESGPDLGPGGHAEIKAAARKAIAAEQQLIAETKDVYKTGRAPRQADSAVGPLLDAVFDVAVVRRTAVSAEDGDAIAQWLRSTIHVGAIYVRAGTGAASLTELGRNAKGREQSDRNVVLYAPEIGRFMDAEIVLETALLGTVFQSGPDSDGAKPGEVKDQMRAGLTMTIVGLLHALAGSGIGHDWRLARLAVLDSSTPTIAKILDPARCRELQSVAAGVAAKLRDPRAKEKLTAFGDRLSCAKA